jgi:hypothetical protein
MSINIKNDNDNLPVFSINLKEEDSENLKKLESSFISKQKNFSLSNRIKTFPIKNIQINSNSSATGNNSFYFNDKEKKNELELLNIRNKNIRRNINVIESIFC